MPFQPKVDILPAPQRKLWGELSGTPKEFVLYGGTALALGLGHRVSEDFGFFSRTSFDAAALYRAIPYLRGSRIDQSSANTLTCAVDRDGPVKVSFFGDLDTLKSIAEPDVVDGVAIASLLDVAATKMRTLQVRAAAKDYIDVAALLESGLSLSEMLKAASAVYGGAFNPVVTLKALSYFGDGDLVSLPEATKARLQRAAKEIG